MMSAQHRLPKNLTTTAGWLVWVLVLNAIMPLMAHAALALMGPTSQVVEICTSTGLVRIPIDSQTEESKPNAAVRMAMQCPVCILEQHSWDIPPPCAMVIPVLVEVAFMPPAFYQYPVTAHVWLAALSRGPPVVF